MRFSILLISLFVPVLINAQKGTDADEKLIQLQTFMSGAFSSELQAQHDSDYYSISLQMKPIWKERKDGFWLYVEQAMFSALTKPYRQRVYHVYRKDENTFVSDVFELRDPLRFAGDYATDDPLLNQNPDSLLLKDGCSITLKAMPDDTFAGSTANGTCRSTLRGADYTSSEVSISRSMLVSWDRGFEKSGKQVWGAEKGGYRFAKIKQYE